MLKGQRYLIPTEVNIQENMPRIITYFSKGAKNS